MKRFTQLISVLVLVLVLGISMATAQEVTFTGGPAISVPLAGNNGGFTWGDVNNDGILDVLFRQNNVMINGITSFTNLATAGLPVGGDVLGIAFADFNGDGLPDVVELSQSPFVPSIWLNSTSGVFTKSTAVGDLANAGVAGTSFSGIAVGDIDHSGYLSLAYAGGPITNGDNPTLPGGGIWLLKGGPTGFTNIGKGGGSVNANVIQNFESNNIGDKLPYLGYSSTDDSSVVALDPTGGTNKVLKNSVANYNSAPVLAITLPAGQKLSNYTKFIFKAYWAQGDVGYKDIVVEASQTLPTGHGLDGSSTTTLGKWNRALMGSTAWEYDTVNITNTLSYSGTVYLDFGINCAGTGNVGGTGVKTIWYADDVTLVGTAAGSSGAAIDTMFTYEAWNAQFLDANNDGYADLLMPSFRGGSSPFDVASISASRKGCILWMNDKTGKFFIPNATTLGRPIYEIDSIVAGVIYAGTKVDTGIVVDDTVRHFEAISNDHGDFNNDGIEDLILSSNNARNRDAYEVAVNAVILYGKGDGTFTYKWNGTAFAGSSGIPQIGGNRAMDVGDYNNDGKLDIFVGCFGGNVYAQYLYRNNGDGTFTDVSTTDGAGTTVGVRSVGFADYNNDGFLDLFSYTNTTTLLLKNGGNTNKWIGFKPIGAGNNTSAVGAMFTLYAGATKQMRTIRADADAKNGGALWANFGIGTATKVDSVQVQWPDGKKQTYVMGAANNTLAVNQYYTVKEGSIIPPASATARPSWAAGDTVLTSNNTLKWKKVTGGTVPITYQAQIGTNKAMSTILYNYTGVADTFKVVKVPLASKFYWRVSTFSNTFQSEWSAVDSFQTNKTPATTIPIKLSPTTNQLRLPKQPTLVCSSTPEAYIYNFQLDTMNAFITRDTATIAANKITKALLFNDSTTVIDTTKQMSALTPGRMYYWRVRGWNAAGASKFSPVDSFTIMYLPATPVLAYPGHNQADVPANPLVLKVNRVDGDSNYVFQTWTYTNAGLSLRIDTTKNDPTLTLTSLLNRQRYYWKVQVYNQGGASAYTAVDSFTTIVELANVPNVLTPKNTTAEPRRTKFVWSKAANAVWYHLQVATSNFLSPSDIVEDVTLQTDTTYTIKDTLKAATLYYWHVSAINLAGETSFPPSAHFMSGYGITGVSQPIAEIPKDYSLLQNYPNPFNPTTTISYELPKASYVKLIIYDVLGRTVANLVDGVQVANRYQVEWNPSHLSSGVYFYRIEARSQDNSSNFTSVKKLLYMK